MTDVVPQTSGVSMPASKVPLALASTNAAEVHPARVSVRQPAGKFAVSTPLPRLASECT